MKIISPAILIAALSASRIHAETHQKDHHKQTYGQQSTGGLRKLNRNETRTHIPAESRIVGGSDADVGEYPFFVDWNGACGASLIHKGELDFFLRKQLTPLLLSPMLTFSFLARFPRHHHISCALCWYRVKYCSCRVVPYIWLWCRWRQWRAKIYHTTSIPSILRPKYCQL